MQTVFTLDYNPIGSDPQRLRVVSDPGREDLTLVTERRVDGDWTELRTEPIDYVAYSDQ